MQIKYISKNTKRLITLVAIIMIISLLATYEFGLVGSSPASYVYAKARLGTISQTIGTTGLLEPATELGLNFGVSGLVQSVNVEPNQRVTKGQILATLNTNTLQNALVQAQTNLSAAKAKLALDNAGPTPTQIQQANSQVGSAQLALSSATVSAQNVSQTLFMDQTDLINDQSQIIAGPAANLYVPTYSVSISNITQIQQILFQDQIINNLDQQSLTYFQQLLSQFENNEQTDCSSSTVTTTSSTSCQQDKSEIASTQIQITLDTQASTQSQSSYNAADQVITAQEQLNNDQLALNDAENAQNALLAPTNTNQLDIDNSTVQADQSQVQAAQYNLTQAELIAPFNGVVGQVNISVGQQATPNAGGSGASAANSNPNASGTGGVVGAIMLIDPSTFQSVASVSDAEISQIKIGNKVLILPSGFSKPLSGTVTQITPVGTLSQGVVAFPVTTTVNNQQEIALFTGESAEITFVVSQVSNVVVVPLSAVHTNGSKTYVYVDSSGNKKRQKVTTGASSSTFIQITHGLSAGNEVILANTNMALPSGNSGLGAGKNKGGIFGGGKGKNKGKGL
jgi:multidrug efflux pump subunit AcrA (membrane-fusion protein)